MEVKLLKSFSLILILIFNSLYLAQDNSYSIEKSKNTDSTSFDLFNDISFNKLTNKQIEFAPVRETKDLLKLFPGLTTYQDQFHLRGSHSDEIAYTISGAPITDLISGEQLLYIPLNIIDEVELLAGSQPITISNSGSGIIEYKLKSGGDKLELDFEQSSDNIGFNGKSSAYSGNERLGAYWHGYSESNLSIGGPIFNTPIKFYVNGNYKFMRDKNPQRYPGVDNLLLSNSDYYNDPFYHDSLRINYPAGIVYGNSIEKYNIYGALDFDFNPLKIKLMGIYDNQLKDVSRNHIQNSLNSRIDKNEKENIFLSVNASHKLSPIFSYNFQANYSSSFEETYDPYLKDNYWAYGDSVANANVGIFWERSDIDRFYLSGSTPEYTRYIPPYSRNFYGFYFNNNSRPPVNYSKLDQEQFSVSGNFDLKLFKNNAIKFGGSYKHGVIRKWNTSNSHIGFAGILARQIQKEYHRTIEEEKIRILEASGVNNIGYDIMGKISNNSFDAPPKPSFTNLFLEYKKGDNNNFVNLGLVYDYIDIDNLLFLDAKSPEKSFDVSSDFELIPKESGFAKSKSFSYLSPRLTIFSNINEKIQVKAHYGFYVKQSNLEIVYNSLNFWNYAMLISGNFYRNGQTFNNYLESTITEKLELSLKYTFSKNSQLKIIGYRINIYNQPSGSFVQTMTDSYFSDYKTSSNNDKTSVSGIELKLFLSPINNLSIQSNFSFIKHSSKYFYDVYISMAHLNSVISIDSPLDYIPSFSTNTIVSYNLSHSNLLINNLIFSTLVTYKSGHQYSLSKGPGNIDAYPRYSTPVNDLINQQTTPSNFQVNFRIDKTIELYNKVNLNFYIYAINIFNNENILDVFLRTGSAKTDGFLEDPNLGGKIIEAYGENYRDIYRLINIQYNPRGGQQNMYGEPRQIIMGIKLNL